MKEYKLEKDLNKDIYKYLSTLKNCFYWKNHGNAYSRIGLPDIMAIHDGKIYCFECKLKTNKATLIQLKVIAIINKCGGIAAVVHSVEEVKRLIEGG